MVEQYVLPMVGSYVELQVLAFKLRASFYHIFVLFHNDPPVTRRTSAGSTTTYSLYPDPLSPRGIKTTPPRHYNSGGSSSGQSYVIGGAVGSSHPPPGLPLPNIPKPGSSATYLLPLLDYTPTATSCFQAANKLAESLLPGSHPVRLSVRVEYVAYMYDCLHAAEESRRLAKQSIRDVYEATEGMDDESFEDAAEMVGVLGRMMKRGLGAAGSSGSGSGGVAAAAVASQPRADPTSSRSSGAPTSGRGNGPGQQRHQSSQQSPDSRRRGNGNGSSHHRHHSSTEAETRRRGGNGNGNGNGSSSSSHRHGSGSRRSRHHRSSVSAAPTTWV